MKNNRRFLAMGLTLVMLGSLFTGCGDSGEAGGGSSASGTESGSAQGEITGEVEIELFSAKSENLDTMQGLVDGFMAENPNIIVTINGASDAGTVL